MFFSKKLALGLALFFTLPAFASDVAVLRNGFTIRHERRAVLGSITRLYVTADGKGYVDIPTSDIDHFEKDLTPMVASAAENNSASATANPPPLDPLSLKEAILSASGRQHLDPDLVNSVIRAESGFDPHAVSPKGAQGLMQLMPQTASLLGVENAFDARANVEAGTRYLRVLLERYDFDLIKALAAYNAGPQRVAQYGGVPPYYETQAYVARIIRDFNRKKLAERKALSQKTREQNRASGKPQSSDSSERAAR
jgi:soluble lytic murein transglycosylase-like protein